MPRRSLRDFDPKTVADLETQMWQAYYRHRFYSLFILLVRLTKSFFGLRIDRAVTAAFFAAWAAADFRLTKGKENQGRIQKKLERFYRIIRKHCLETFDPKEAARCELSWWMIDRYPERYSETREAAIAQGMAAIYQTNSEQLKEFATLRARAMTLQDAAEAEGVEADWQSIRHLLRESYESLHAAIL